MLNTSAHVTSLAIDSTHLYWTENEGDQGLNETTPTVVAYDQNYPFAVAVDDTSVYWINAGHDFSAGRGPPVAASCAGSVMKAPKL